MNIIIERDEEEDMTETWDISVSMLLPARTKSVQIKPSKFDDYLMVQVTRGAPVNNTYHKIDNVLIAQYDYAMAIWGYLMTQ